MTSALSFNSLFHLQNLARPRRECGKILWPQKGQEKGLERRKVVRKTWQGQRLYPNEPKLPFSHTDPDRSALKGRKIDFIYK